ncbi:MAG TPA: GNAT family N-acetyltransferase [Candidatus Limnocylindrales bacterium]|jgi:GNAT superfamily N-acetyltransferase|nr:GNAT family N-acetyltransferase [Candidatus Limnocylindrales bacterium]
MATVARVRARVQTRVEAQATRDRALLRTFLERDRLFAGYALCDLDDREFPRTRWGVAVADGRPIAVGMEYSGLSPQSLFVMGEPEGIEAVLRRIIRPRAAFVACLPEVLPSVSLVYRTEAAPTMVRMWVDRRTFRPHGGIAMRLLPAEIGDLNRLYGLGFTTWLPAEAIMSGVYYGVRVAGRLIAAAGTHVVSPSVGMAVVGNVMTHRDYRNHGYAKLVTSAVTQDLLRSVDQVVLNVRSDNPPAIAAYRALGFDEHIRFDERLAHRRGPGLGTLLWPIRRLFSNREP